MSSKRKADGEQQKPKRRRISTVRTGCRTCKQRHLKCDEEKPRCRRCRDAGWPCGLSDYPHIPSACTSAPISRQLTVVPGTPLERRALRYFQDHALRELSGWVPSIFWMETALQRGVANQAVRHALVAVSAVHEKYQSSDSANSQLMIRAAGDEEQFGLSQYTSAIGLLRDQMSTTDKTGEDAALICCLLFICFDNLRGNLQGALTHLQAGINIIQGMQRKVMEGATAANAEEVKARAAAKLRNDGEKKNILAHFARLDIQATSVFPGRGLMLKSSKVESDMDEEQPFKTLRCARDRCERLSQETLTLVSPMHRNSEDVYGPKHALASARVLLTRFDQWDKHLDHFVKVRWPSLNEIGRRAFYLLKMQHKCMTLMIRMALGEAGLGPIAPAEYEEVLDLSKLACQFPREYNEPHRIRMPTYQCSMAVIGALYWVATHAPDLSTRRRAIQLLRQRRRREGMWDSINAARMAELLLIKEMNSPGKSVLHVAEPGVPTTDDLAVLESHSQVSPPPPQPHHSASPPQSLNLSPAGSQHFEPIAATTTAGDVSLPVYEAIDAGELGLERPWEGRMMRPFRPANTAVIY